MKESSRANPLRPPLRAARVALRAAWAALALLPVLPAPGGAQVGDAEMAVVRAALPRLREALPPGPAALDPEGFCEARLIGWDCPPAFREEAEALGFRLSGRAFTLLCLGGPRSCRLVGTESLVILSPPEVARGRATLEATVWRRLGTGSRPIGESRLRLRLARRAGAWEVVGEDPALRD